MFLMLASGKLVTCHPYQFYLANSCNNTNKNLEIPIPKIDPLVEWFIHEGPHFTHLQDKDTFSYLNMFIFFYQSD